MSERPLRAELARGVRLIGCGKTTSNGPEKQCLQRLFETRAEVGGCMGCNADMGYMWLPEQERNVYYVDNNQLF